MELRSYSLNDFKIGDMFKFRADLPANKVTDIGSRTLTYIRLDKDDERDYKGPPYSVVEYVLDEYDLEALIKL